MLEKTIKSVLNKKVNEWLKSIDDIEIVSIIKQNLIITGGCFTSMLQNEKPKDYDVYFKTRDAAIAVANYYVSRFNADHAGTEAKVITKNFNVEKMNDEEEKKKITQAIKNINDRIKIFIQSAGVAGNMEKDIPPGEDPVDIISELDAIPAESIEVKEKYRPVFLSSNAITLSDGIQIVVRFYGKPNQIHETYDFVHTKAYWTLYDNEIIIPREVYEAVMNKTLIYTGSKYPLCSIIRMRKFIKRGWSINAGQILKMIMQAGDLDLHDIDTLEDQLIGVDSLYFTQLILQFRAAKEKNSNWSFDTNYVVSIIDKIF